MQESFRGVDASIAGHVSNASQYTITKSSSSTNNCISNKTSLIMIVMSRLNQIHHFGRMTKKTVQSMIDDNQRKTIPHQRNNYHVIYQQLIVHYLDRPSDLNCGFLYFHN